MWFLKRYTYDSYLKKLRSGNFRDPWVVHQGALYMFFSGYEQEAISTVRVALSFSLSPMVVRTLAFLEGMYYGIARVYAIYKKYFRKLLTDGYDAESYKWEILLVGDLAFYMGDEEKGWFYYKKYPYPHSEYMLRRKARFYYHSSPKDSRLLYEKLHQEGRKMSLGDVLRYAYLLGPKEGRKFLYGLVNNEEIGKLVVEIADKSFDYLKQYIDDIQLLPLFEGIISREYSNTKHIVISVEVLSHLLGAVYMPWSNMFLSRKGLLQERIKIPYVMWDWGYAYEYHYAYLPPWWREGVSYLEDRWNVSIAVLSKKKSGKRRCIWGNKVVCGEVIDIYDNSMKPILKVE